MLDDQERALHLQINYCANLICCDLTPNLPTMGVVAVGENHVETVFLRILKRGNTVAVHILLWLQCMHVQQRVHLVARLKTINE